MGGRDEQSWGPVPEGFEWLQRQSVFSLTSQLGAIVIFREVSGLEGQWAACWERSSQLTTASEIPYASLSGHDMLACQMALPENERRLDRIRYLQQLMQ
jgi:hypothetical protein